MRTVIYVLVMVITMTVTVSAQTKTIITGMVNDKQGKGLPQVAVSLLSAKDSSLEKAAITNNDGEYELATDKKGSFLISYSATGHNIMYSDTFKLNGQESYKLATSTIRTTTAGLSDITVVARKPLIEVKTDKLVLNVENSINATGSNAMELLHKSPGITVDNNDNISMKGKTGVKIYVDGKMVQLTSTDLVDYLKSINSSDIEAIEMISNPSAKYDASGNAGIINLKLKKNKKYGTNGNASATFIQGITPKGNGSVSLNYRNKKVNLFSNLGGDIGNWDNTLFLYRIQQDTIYDEHSITHVDKRSSNVKAGADYFINSKNTIGIMVNANFNDVTHNSNSNTIINYYPTNTYIKTLIAENAIPGSKTNANFNFNYRYVDTTGKEVNFDADYGLYKGRGASTQPNYYYYTNPAFNYDVINKNNTPTDINIYTSKLDVEQKKWKGVLGYGVKFSYVKTTNSFDFYNVLSGVDVKSLSSSNGFVYTENVNAAYVNYNRTINTNWSIQAGLRVEQTNSEGVLTRADGIIQPDDDVKKNYIDLFPSAAITWNINSKHSLNLTYSKRIDRPAYQSLNPFENKLDELTYEKGNAFLRPQYTNNVELTHTFMGFINTSVGYSHVSDYTTETTDTVNNATYVQQKNLATQQIINFNIGAPTPIKKWWNGYVNFWFAQSYFDGMIGANKVSVVVPAFGVYAQQSFSLGKDYTAELSGFYDGPNIWGATWHSKPQGGIDLGLQKLALNKKATIKISYTDVLGTMSPWLANVNFGGLNVNGGGTWESRTFRLSVSYRFGNKNVQESRKRKVGSETEAGRIKA